MAAPMKPCLECGALSIHSRCPKHTKAKRKRHNDDRTYYKSPHWKRLRSQCMARFENVCAICGSDDRVAAHHMDPRTHGVAEPTSQDRLDNLIALCAVHHGMYEADLRAGRASSLRAIVEAMNG